MKLGEYELPELPEGYTYRPISIQTPGGGQHVLEVFADGKGVLMHFWLCSGNKQRYEWCVTQSCDWEGLEDWHRVGPKIGQIIIREITKHRLGLHE